MPTLDKLVGGPLGNIAKFLLQAWQILEIVLRLLHWHVLQNAREAWPGPVTWGPGRFLKHLPRRTEAGVMQTSWKGLGQFLGDALGKFLKSFVGSYPSPRRTPKPRV